MGIRNGFYGGRESVYRVRKSEVVEMVPENPQFSDVTVMMILFEVDPRNVRFPPKNFKK